jgi:hypothetical protein
LRQRTSALPRDIAAARQLQNQQLVQGRDRGKVEAVQALHSREARLTNAPLNQPPLAIQQLKFAQAKQIAGVVDPLGRALDALRRDGIPVSQAVLAHLAPLGWEHVNLTGDYVWAAEQSPSENIDGLRPLRAFAGPSLQAA